MLQKIHIAPGFNKQVTATGGEGQWVSGDYVRFRYGSPEKNRWLGSIRRQHFNRKKYGASPFC